MNVLLFGAPDLDASGSLVVSDHRLDNLHEVQQAEVGSRLRVGEIGGQLGWGEVQQIDAHSATLNIALDAAPPAKLPLELVVALPRPKMLRRILRTVAELGVPRLHLINSYRVEKSFWQSPVLSHETSRSYLLQGLEQAVDTVLPELHLHRRFKPFAEDILPTLTSGRSALVGHPAASEACPRNLTGKLALLAIGPEGGFTDYEIGLLSDAGCRPVTLGPRILRVENAVNSLIGRLY